jgi:D-aminopeptidase
MNSITDVEGVGVGHSTLIRGDDIRTGVTAIVPHQGNPYEENVTAAVDLFNAYGKATGLPQIMLEEAIVNALFGAETMTGRDGNTRHALPLDQVERIFEKYGRPLNRP